MIQQAPLLAIIGCGWLGRQFIRHAQHTYTLRATGSAADLPIPAYPYRWENRLRLLPEPLCHADAYLIALPPSAGGREHYAENMRKLVAQLPQAARVLMVSSTSVYPQLPGLYDENSAILAAHPVSRAETAVRGHPLTTIVRSGGQYGAGRMPLPHENRLPDKRLNLISGENLCRALLALLRYPSTVGQVYNLVEPDHPWRSGFARRFLTYSIEFTENHEADRLIDGSRITRDTDFRYA